MTINVTDTIHIHSLNTGSTVGNGGNGTFNGDIINKPYLSLDQSNTVTGSTNDVDGHHVHSSIDANTHADQSNTATVDQSQSVMLGLGGSGGNDNMIIGSGNVDFNLDPHIHV
jgi:hypothetical protein